MFKIIVIAAVVGMVSAALFTNTCTAAKTCIACLGDENCNWYQGAAGVQSCDKKNAFFKLNDIGNKVMDTCGTCFASACEECNEINGCDWYELKLIGGNRRCLDKSPKKLFVPTHKKLAACPVPEEDETKANKAACRAANTCSACQLDAKCGWYEGKLNKVQSCSLLGGSDLKLGDRGSNLITTCSTCSVSNCQECNEIDGCDWYGLKRTGGNNRCLDKSPTLPTHEKLAACPVPEEDETKANKAACRAANTCSACQLDAKCGWYEGKLNKVQSCSLLGGSDLKLGDIGSNLITTCGTCSVSTCDECSEIDGCDWYKMKRTGGNNRCLDKSPTLPGIGTETHEITTCEAEAEAAADAEAEAARVMANGASSMQISLAALVVTGVATLFA